MRAARLLRLYPRAWRDRYGEEFLDVVGQDAVTMQQAIDLVSGAIDAWLSTDVRTATRVASTAPAGGPAMTVRTMLCRKTDLRYTNRDSLLAAIVMIGVTAAASALGLALKDSGWTTTSQIVLNVAFTGSMTISLPFWLMKGQPWRAQAAIVGGTVALLVVIAWLAATA
jgi:hypothetical protein